MFWNLIKLNLLFCLFGLPSAALLVLGMVTPLGVIAFALSLAAAFPVGGAVAACFFCISKMIRRDPGYLWYDFKRKLSENIKQGIVPGILCVAFIYAQIYLWQLLIPQGANILWFAAGFIPLLIFGMVAPYVFLQMAYIKLRTLQILKNSLLISFGNAGRSITGAVLCGIIWLVFILLMPDSLPFSPILLVLGFSTSWLLNLLFIWPPVNRQFGIDEALRKQYEDNLT